MSEYSEDEHILFISSDQSLTFYPENKPFHFKVNLSESIYLPEGETWEMGVVDFYTPTVAKKNDTRELYILSDLCMGVNVFHNQYSGLLRRIFPTLNSWNNVFSHPLYVPVKKTEIHDLEVHILTERGEDASFLTQRLSFTLHIRSKKRRASS